MEQVKNEYFLNNHPYQTVVNTIDVHFKFVRKNFNMPEFASEIFFYLTLSFNLLFSDHHVSINPHVETILILLDIDIRIF